MPVTCRDTITRALRKVRVYGAGITPSNEDAEDALDELKNLYEQWATSGMFGRIADVTTAEDYDANPGERIRVTETATVTIPTEFAEDGVDYPPYDMSYIEVVDVPNQEVLRYIYENGAWVEINALTLDSEAPLATRGNGGLAACLALALADEHGVSAGPMVVRQAAAFKTGLSLKLGSDAPRTAPDYF